MFYYNGVYFSKSKSFIFLFHWPIRILSLEGENERLKTHIYCPNKNEYDFTKDNSGSLKNLPTSSKMWVIKIAFDTCKSSFKYHGLTVPILQMYDWFKLNGSPIND